MTIGFVYNRAMLDSLAPICLTNHFLIAMPAMTDPNFARSLTYICEHNDQGALGLVVNRPTDMNLTTLFERINIPFGVDDQTVPFGAMPVYHGGPVQNDRGFVLHRPLGNWQSTLMITDEIGLTSTRDVLLSIGSKGEPSDILVTLGYAGWSAGQIEWELSQNAWLSVAADPQIIFATPPEARLNAAMHLLGVDFTNLSKMAGHA